MVVTQVSVRTEFDSDSRQSPLFKSPLFGIVTMNETS